MPKSSESDLQTEIASVKSEIADVKQAVEVIADQVAQLDGQIHKALTPRNELPPEFTHGITLDKVFYSALQGAIASTLANQSLARIIERDPLCRSQARQMIAFAKVLTEEFARMSFTK